MTDQKKRGRPKGSKARKPSEMKALFVNFKTRDERRACDRLAAFYGLSRAGLIRALIAEADKLREAGRTLVGVKEAAE